MPDDQTNTDQQQTQTNTDQQQQATNADGQQQAQQSQADQGQEAQDVASLPKWAQKLIGGLRDEAGKDRTAAKQAAAEEARKAMAQEIGKALGLIESPDPAAAAKQTADERDAARQEAKAAKVENAVLRLAAKHGAAPEALTDSRSFMTKLADIDPTAEDFSEKVEEAIKAAVEANPSLKGQTPAPPRSGGRVGGGTPVAGQLTREDIKSMSPDEIEKAREEGRLKNLLGQS